MEQVTESFQAKGVRVSCAGEPTIVAGLLRRFKEVVRTELSGTRQSCRSPIVPVRRAPRYLDLYGRRDGLPYKEVIRELLPEISLQDRMKCVMWTHGFKKCEGAIKLDGIQQVFRHMKWTFPRRPHRTLNSLIRKGLVEETSLDAFVPTEKLMREMESRLSAEPDS